MGQKVLEVVRPVLREAYDLVLAQWPEIIVAGDKTFHLNDGCNMRTLNDTHFPIEDWATQTAFREEIDQIIGSVEWCVFQAIHGALQNLTSLRKADLDFEAFVSRFDGHPNYRVVSEIAG